jgi:hypothetical protein
MTKIPMPRSPAATFMPTFGRGADVAGAELDQLGAMRKAVRLERMLAPMRGSRKVEYREVGSPA